MDARQLHLPQNIRKTKPMSQTEKKGDSIAFDGLPAQQILQSDVCDAQCDRALRQPARQHDDIECRERKCNAVGHGERRNDLDQRPQLSRHNHKAHEKCQVVVSSKDVHDSKAQKSPECLEGRVFAGCKYRYRVATIKNRLMDHPVQIYAGEMLMAGPRNLIERRSHRQLMNIVAELIIKFSVEDMILDHSIPFQRHLNRKIWTHQNVVLFDIPINAIDRVVELVVRNESTSAGIDIPQLKKI